jgi:hypothetical protein
MDEVRTPLRALLEAMKVTGEPLRIGPQGLPGAGQVPQEGGRVGPLGFRGGVLVVKYFFRSRI